MKYIYLAVTFLIILFIFSAAKERKILHKISQTGDCSEKKEYSLTVMNSFKEEMINQLIKHDKEMRKALLLHEGKSEIETGRYIASLEHEYMREYEKFLRYCDRSSDQCKIKTTVQYKDTFLKEYSIPNNVESIIQYKFDDESKKFFNSIRYVGNINIGNQKIWNDESIPIFLNSKPNKQLNNWKVVGYVFSSTGPYICDCLRCDYLRKRWFMYEKLDKKIAENKTIKVNNFVIEKNQITKR